MKTLILITVGAMIIQILAVYTSMKVRNLPRNNISAEDIISGNIPVQRQSESKPQHSKQLSLPAALLTSKLNEKKIQRQKEEQQRKLNEVLEKIKEIEKANEGKIIIVERDPKVEEKYQEVKILFSTLIKERKLNREYILAIRDFLRKNVSNYEKKKYKNDAHEIYVMLKAKDLSLDHLEEINRVLKIRSL